VRGTILLFQDCLLDIRSNTVSEKQDLAAEKFLQLFSNRLQGELLLGFAIGSTEVGHQRDSFCLMIDAELDCGQRSHNALIIGDLVWRLLLLRNLS
jgi:hypothetical protein